VRGSVKDANALRAELLVEVERHGPSSSHTMAELFDRVIDHLETLGREPTTIFSYRLIAVAVTEKLRQVPVGKLPADHLDQFYEELLRGGRSAARVRRYHAVVHRCFAQAVRWDGVRENVADRATLPSEPRRRFAVRATDAVVALIRAAEESRTPELGVAFRLLASVGGRRGEVCGLQWRDFDLDAATCTIRRAITQVTGRPVIVGDVKTHQERTVLLDAGTVEVLRRHRQPTATCARVPAGEGSPPKSRPSE